MLKFLFKAAWRACFLEDDAYFDSSDNGAMLINGGTFFRTGAY